MISSMTGFGKGEAHADGLRFSVEIRTVNGRYGDVSVHLPRFLNELEARIKELVLESFERGRIDVSVSAKGDLNGQGLPRLNEEVVGAYLSELRQLKDREEVLGDVTIAGLAGLPNVFMFDTASIDVEAAWLVLKPSCVAAAEQCVAMRRAEGAKLAEDFGGRLARLRDLVAEVEKLAPGRTESARKRLEEKLEALLEPGQVDAGRLLTEVALIAERGDITEECVRFRSHNDQFEAALDQSEAVGRRLSFLLQEMLREANTIGSKASDAEIAHLVVEIKEEIEKLKEQALNVE